LKKILIALFSIIFVFAALSPTIYGWFIDGEIETIDVNGYSTNAYFAYGNGSEEKPFGIKHPRHLYNLAWLQYLGYFNNNKNGELDHQYYFEISDDIEYLDMKTYQLPPIGTLTNPFVGVFNGNGKVIKNLTVGNNLSKMNFHPSSVNDVKSANMVGLFGVIGNYKDLYKNITDSSVLVKNLYLDDVVISSDSDNTLAGFVCGYCAKNASVEYIGVHHAGFNFKEDMSAIDGFDRISYYSLIGMYYKGDGTQDDGGIEWNDEPTGDVGYGQSTDIYALSQKMTSILGNTNSIDKNQYLPFHGTGVKVSNNYSIGEEADDTNIGYFIGNDIKYNNKPKSNFYPKYYSPTSSTGYINSVNVDEKSNVYKSTFGSNETDIPLLRLQAKLDINNNLVTIRNAKIGGVSYETVKLPRRCVWVKPVVAGKMRFVMANLGDGQNFTLSKFKRQTFGDLSSTISGLETLIETNNLGGGLPSASEVTHIDGASASIDSNKYTVFYFEWEVTKNDISEGYEFALSRDNGSNGSYFWYLDMGTDGNNAGAKNGHISHIDFVYFDNNAYQDITSDSFEYSNLLVYIEGQTTTLSQIYFRRIKELGLCYYDNNSGLTLVLSGSGEKTKSSDSNCES
jgi:hypothetical protein